MRVTRDVETQRGYRREHIPPCRVLPADRDVDRGQSLRDYLCTFARQAGERRGQSLRDYLCTFARQAGERSGQKGEGKKVGIFLDQSIIGKIILTITMTIVLSFLGYWMYEAIRSGMEEDDDDFKDYCFHSSEPYIYEINNSTVSMGPFLDVDGNALIGAFVTIQLGNEIHSNITDKKGMITIIINHSVPLDFYKVRVESTGTIWESEIYIGINKK